MDFYAQMVNDIEPLSQFRIYVSYYRNLWCLVLFSTLLVKMLFYPPLRIEFGSTNLSGKV